MANTASGGVGPGAPDEARAILAEFGVEANVHAPEGDDLEATLRRAVDAGPDLLVVLAGDGTARAAVELCGPKGPMVAPLPGGTMNMLPHAVYGQVSWQQALKAALSSGESHEIGGGEVEGHTFLVAAILGAPALWAPAREAARHGDLRMAWRRANLAWRRAFSGRLRYALDAGPRGKAEAVGFICPLASRALDDETQALEAAVLTPSGASEAFRMAFNAMTGDWRRDPAVEAVRCRRARVWASGSLPAVLDGEPVRLRSTVEVVWRPLVARILAPPAEAEAEAKTEAPKQVGP
ncbi:MAG TPA: diacylglycerol kinase family protein [Phenylobacterium sp.]|nr:diacylglycerol kinase family protein [Phenylobacterium sp.]